MINKHYAGRVRAPKLLALVSLCLFVFVLYNYTLRDVYSKMNEVTKTFGLEQEEISNFLVHQRIVDQYFSRRKSLTTSKLGSIMYKNVEYAQSNIKNRTFVILVWKHWDWLKNRHIYHYGSTRHDPLADCSVNNCNFTGDDKILDTADAVVVHLQRGLIPKVEHRNRLQRWIFLIDETPLHTFSLASNPPELSDLANVFNWSMTYRSDADIPVPYGRTLPLPDPIFFEFSQLSIDQLVPHWEGKRRDVLATVLMSNCGVKHRMNLLNDLKKHVKIDIHGKCSDDKKLVDSCPGHFKADCEVISEYLFYLVLENSMCEQYMTEKLFYHAYAKGAIPVIQGPSLEDCELFLPPNSYLHVDNFATPADLANEILSISKDDEKLLSYHMWRYNFEVANEHGYFGSNSYHLCRACEAMNYNGEQESIYDDARLKLFIDPSKSCKT